MGEKKTIECLRNNLGYVDLKTKGWHHILIAVVGYFLMLILTTVFSEILAIPYENNGMDFSCIIGGTPNGGVCNEQAGNVYFYLASWAQVIAQLLVILSVAAIFIKFIVPFVKPLKEKKTWFWFAVTLVTMIPLNMLYNELLELINSSSSSSNQSSVVSMVESYPFLGFLLIVVAGPIFEEVIFRLGLFRAFLNKGKKMEILGFVISLILFVSIHFMATASAVISSKDMTLLVNDLLTIPGYVIAGFAVTFTYYKTKNFITPVIFHMTWNFTQFLIIIISSVI